MCWMCLCQSCWRRTSIMSHFSLFKVCVATAASHRVHRRQNLSVTTHHFVAATFGWLFNLTWSSDNIPSSSPWHLFSFHTDLLFIYLLLLYFVNLFIDLSFGFLINILQVQSDAIVASQVPVRKVSCLSVTLNCFMKFLQKLLFYPQIVVGNTQYSDSVLKLFL